MQYKTAKIFVLMQYLTYIHEKGGGITSPPFPIYSNSCKSGKNHSLYLPPHSRSNSSKRYTLNFQHP